MKKNANPAFAAFLEFLTLLPTAIYLNWNQTGILCNKNSLDDSLRMMSELLRICTRGSEIISLYSSTALRQRRNYRTLCFSIIKTSLIGVNCASVGLSCTVVIVIFCG